MANFNIAVLFVLSTVALVNSEGLVSTSLSYRQWQASDLTLVRGQAVKIPVKGGRCKPIGQLNVNGCTGESIYCFIKFDGDISVPL